MILKKISPWFLFQVLSLPFLAQSFNEAPNLKLQTFCFNDSIYLLCTVRPSDLVYKRLSEREGFICGMRIRYGYTDKTSDFNFLGESVLSYQNPSSVKPSNPLSAILKFPKNQFLKSRLSLQYADLHTGKEQGLQVDVNELSESKETYKLTQSNSWVQGLHLNFNTSYEIQLADTAVTTMELLEYRYWNLLPKPMDDISITEEPHYRSQFIQKDQSGHFSFKPEAEGVYVFRRNAQSKGIVVYVSGNAQYWNMASDLFWPALYLSETENSSTSISDNPHKKDLDSLWLHIGKSKVLARKILKSFYRRVSVANQKYTEELPGFLTDKGMVYILFGKPTQTILYADEETWIYGPLGSPSTLRISFSLKFKFPMWNTKHWVLNRSQQYHDVLESVTEAWRSGKILE